MKLPPKKVVNALLPKLLSLDDELKWRAVTVAGMITADLAKTDMEAARIILRRMIWNLTEESGTCAWGAPELMAEAMANHRGLAEEFCRILVSFIVPHGNYLEFEPLQRGAVWGIGRLAMVYPDLLQGSQKYLCDLLNSSDKYVRGLTCWALIKLGNFGCISEFKSLTDNDIVIPVFQHRKLDSINIGSMIAEALQSDKRNTKI